MHRTPVSSILATAAFAWACSNGARGTNAEVRDDGGTGGSRTGSAGSSSGTGGLTSANGGSGAATNGAPTGGTTNGGGASGSNAGGSPGSGGATGGSAMAGGAPGASDAGGVPVYPAPVTEHLTVGVHDPSMIHAGSKYYLFATGGRLGIRASSDLLQWSNAGTIFVAMPAWIATELGQQITDLWAPDISFFGGLYRVYYAGSVFGSNHSVIGLATNTTLDSTSAGYKWVDQGLVIESNEAGGPKDDFNAIDPSVTMDGSGQPWLVFGSFWSGVKLRRLDPGTGKPSTTDTQLHALASASEGIEAPSIVSHDGYYYLFVSYDACCKGVSSTYRTMVGRASVITGPYTDRTGQAMLQGNAEQLLATSGRYIGPGGGTAFQDGARYYYAYHYYDGQAGGASYLMMRPILWSTDDWPILGTALWE